MKNRIIGIIAIIFTILLVTPSAGAWGRTGHRVAAMLAEERLTPQALLAIHELLGPDVSLANISTWADEIRDVEGIGSTWHYVDVPITESRYDAKYCQPEGCVVGKIKDFERVLRDPKADKLAKQEALKFFVHFIEDMHQPLHVWDTGSKGGNLMQVLFFDQDSSLHRVWDSDIIERYPVEEALLRDVKQAVNPALAAKWSKGTPEQWATESLLAARKAYYLPSTSTVMPSGTKLDEGYCRIVLPIIREQLAKAGTRVAWALNQVFK
jgi:nuclease S1